MAQPTTSTSHSRPETPSSSRLPRWFRHVSLRRKHKARRDMKAMANNILDVIQTMLDLGDKAADDAEVPFLKLGLGALKEVVKKIQLMKNNVQGVNTLDAHIAKLFNIIQALYARSPGDPLPPEMKLRIEAVMMTWSNIAEQAREIKSYGRIKRFFTGNADARKLEGLVQAINASIQEDIIVKGILNVEEILRSMKQKVEFVQEGVGVVQQEVEVVQQGVTVVQQGVEAVQQGVAGVHQEIEITHEAMEVVGQGVVAVGRNVDVVGKNVDAVGVDVQAVYEEVKAGRKDAVGEQFEALFKGRYAQNARYNASNARRYCLEGTRVDILKRLYQWVSLAISYRKLISSEDPGSVFWISGFAGTGKTTIACSLARHCRDLHILGASFFCSRFDAECSDPDLVFTTISRQLCYFHPPFKEKIVAILKANPDAVHAGIEEQFRELILDPLEELGDSFPLTVVVLDALDECLEKNATSTILSVIAKYVTRISRFLLFIATSRPEPHITALFERSRAESLHSVTTPLLLHMVELGSVLNDIRLYLETELKQHIGVYEVDSGWPSTADIDKLAELSHGLFIWAATALLFIMDKAFSDPQEQLCSLIDKQPAGQTRDTILVSLYQQIAQATSARVSGPLMIRRRAVLGALVLVQEPLSILALASLVDMPENAVRNTLKGLQSVLHIPEDSAEPIRIIHPTFAEFLLNSIIPKPAAFCIDSHSQHAALLAWCLNIMEALKPNIAGIKKPAAFWSETSSLPDSVKKHISLELSYACRHWIAHLDACARGELQKLNYEQLRHFLETQMLHWLEACSLLRALDGAIATLETAQRVCQNLGEPFSRLAPLLADTHRFTRTFFVCIDAAPLQVYHSALSLAPAEIPVRSAYTQLPSDSLIVRRGGPTRWAPCLDVIQAPIGQFVYSVAFSPDGRSFVTGGAGGKVTIWNTAGRTVIQSFVGDREAVRRVVFSPDGLHVAAGSDDGKVRIWQVLSGNCVQTLEGHTGSVHTVAYSTGGTRVLSAAGEGEVKLWNAANWCCLHTLDKTGNNIWQVAISPGGDVIGQGAGTSLCLYNVSSNITDALEHSGKVLASAFSPDGRYVAARTDASVRIWRCADKSLVRSIDVRGLTGPLEFSSDSTSIGCAADHCVYLLQIESNAAPRNFRGHTHDIWDISWSPDRLQVISSGGFDGTVRVWDVSQASDHGDEHTTASERAASTGVPHFATVDFDGPILLHLPSLGIDVQRITVSPLPEGVPTLILSADIADAWDTAVQLRNDPSKLTRTPNWAFVTGCQHIDCSWTYTSRRPISISPDGSLMACQYDVFDRRVNICNLRTGESIMRFPGGPRRPNGFGRVLCITFSPDGTLIAFGSADDTLAVWNYTTGRYFNGERPSSVNSCAFSSDTRFVAFGSSDGSVCVLEVATWRVVQVLEPHQGWVMEVMFSADNTHIVSLAKGGRVYVWDVGTGSCVWTESFEDDSWVTSLTFSPDNTGIVVVDFHNVARTIPLWKSGSRAWPVFMVSNEGWVYGKSPGRTTRLCWLPPEWRNIFSLDSTTFCAPDFGRRRSVVFDVSRIPEYVATWGSGSE